MTAKGPHEGGMQRGLEGRELGALNVCILQQEIAGEVTGALTQDGAPRCLRAACPLIALCLAKNNESATLHLPW